MAKNFRVDPISGENIEVKDTGGPAFPQKEGRYDDGSYHIIGEHGGMTLRDYFAAQAINALVDSWIKNGGIAPEDIASDAFCIADAMLEARKK